MAETALLSLFIDGLILLFLAVTIVYAARLSIHLKRFRDNKAELEKVIIDLSTHIEKADKAIKGLNLTVKESSKELKSHTDNATAMADELQIIIESGDSMANRLEALAVKNRKILEGDTGDLEELRKLTQEHAKDPYDDRVENVVRHADKGRRTQDEPVKSVFDIRDMDVERGDQTDSGFTFDGDDDDILSEAERDLYAALQGRTKRKGKG